MKKESPEELERRPIEVRQKIAEMKRVREQIHEALKGAQAGEEKAVESRLRSVLKQSAKSALKVGAVPYPLKVKQTHSLGDFYGKFHPSKSKKGIKRSEH